MCPVPNEFGPVLFKFDLRDSVYKDYSIDEKSTAKNHSRVHTESGAERAGMVGWQGGGRGELESPDVERERQIWHPTQPNSVFWSKTCAPECTPLPFPTPSVLREFQQALIKGT